MFYYMHPDLTLGVNVLETVCISVATCITIVNKLLDFVNRPLKYLDYGEVIT